MNTAAGQAKDVVIAKILECSKADFGRKPDYGASAATPEASTAGAQPSDGVNHALVAGTITHVPGEAGTAVEQPMDVVKTPGTVGTVAIPIQK